MAAAVLALLASVAWGVADFAGGALSRRVPASVVLLVSQLAGTAVAAVAVAAGGWRAPGGYLAWAAAAGAAGAFALGLFYRALAIGTMSVVAPIAGSGLVVPVAAGLVAGERPRAAQLAGIVVAGLGVLLASGPELRGAGRNPRSVGYAVLAALGFGASLTTTAEAADAGVAMTLLVSFATASALAAGWVATHRPPAVPARGDTAAASGVGVLNVAAVGGYALASRSGLVSVVAVLASLYPVVTVLLARRVYAERLRPVQVAGVSAALAGAVLLAAG